MSELSHFGPWRQGLLGVTASLAMLLAPSANAGCSRADVDHFLGRGFTPEQVVLLCGGDVSANSKDTDAKAIVQESTEAERELRDLLLRSVDARRVDVDGKRLRWEGQLCAEYAPPNLAGRPRERCGPVTITAARDTTTVGEVRERVLIFGEHGVELRGRIEQAWQMDLQGLSAADRRRLQDNSPAITNSALLPLHDRVDPAEIAGALRRWIDAKP